MKLLAFLLFTFGLLEISIANQTCPPGQYFVRGHNRKGYVRADGTIVNPTQVKPHCKAYTKAWEFLEPLFKSGLPQDWPHKTEKSALWTEEDKERLREALEELPDILMSKKISGIYRLKKSKDYPNPASHANGIIVIYDTSFEPSRNLARILAHELAHQSFSDFSSQTQQDYRLAAGWHLKVEKNRVIYWTGRQSGYVKEDGKNSFEEDYANNLEHYLFDSDKLKDKTPAVYEWIKKHFGKDFKLKRQKK